MGKERKKRKHYSRSTSSSRNRPIADCSGDERSPSPSDMSESELAKLKPIGAYVNDRTEMVNQMFASLRHGHHLKSIMPDILKTVPLEELKKMCTEELEGMSKKRIRCILAGEDMLSSSGTDESSSEDEMEAKAAPNPQPSPAKQGNAIATDDRSNDYPQPDSTSGDPEILAKCEPCSANVVREADVQCNDDDFGLEEPIVDIVLEEPSPLHSPEQQSPREDTNAPDADSCDSDASMASPIGAQEAIPEELESQEQGNDDEAGILDGIRMEEPSSDLEEGEISDSPVSNRGFQHDEHRIQSTEQPKVSAVAQPNQDDNESMIKECDNPEEATDTVMENNDVHESAYDDEAENMNFEDADVDEMLMAEVQAQDNIMFGDDPTTSSIPSCDATAAHDEPLEFLEEPIGKLDEGKTSAGRKDVIESFTWQQQATVKPAGTGLSGSVDSGKEVDDSIEPYDDDSVSQDGISSSTDDLLPPGFECLAAAKKAPCTQSKAACSNNTDQTSPAAAKRNTAGILPIRTLYNQLKQHRLASLKRRLKPKIYGPQPLKRIIREVPKPAGPALPPVSGLSDPASVPTASEGGKAAEKKKKKSTSSEVLTPEFLAELEKRRLEHERDMKAKQELLEKLRLEREKLAMREREIEETMKKKLELGLFDDQECGKTRKRGPKGINVTKESDMRKVTIADTVKVGGASPAKTRSVEDDFESSRKSELLELELRAKAIRSLMKVHDDS